MGLDASKPIGNQDTSERRGHFLAEVLSGLAKPAKELPSKYFYDERGASLFKRICTLDEYYIPRVESEIMARYAEDMAEALAKNALLIELGSGDCAKTRMLLDHLATPSAYIPVDICREQLMRVARELEAEYPNLEVIPLCADFTSDFKVPRTACDTSCTTVYIAGSNIGNFDPPMAQRLLKHIASLCGQNGGLLISVDLEKDPSVLQQAYNDSQGVTAAFNLNILRHINRELGADFNPKCFTHHAFYNPHQERVEMHLVSLKTHAVRLDNTTVHFAEGESILTESCYKFTLESFEKTAAQAGFEVKRVWTDDMGWFSVQYLVNRDGV